MPRETSSHEGDEMNVTVGPQEAEEPRMSQEADAPVLISIERADFYPHRKNLDPLVKKLDTTHLVVDFNVHEVGMVTLAASTQDGGSDPYGIEFDLDPSAARLLAAQLNTAAAQVTAEASEEASS
jgi:hypothetical protein